MSRNLSVGALVNVLPDIRRGRPNSEGGQAWIKSRSSSPTCVAYDVEYVLTRKLSKNVDPDRLSAARIDTTRRRPRSASDDIPIQPSLLSTHHHAAQQLLSLSVTPSPPKRAKSTSILVTLVTTAVLLDRSRNFNGDGDGTKHPIYLYLKRASGNNKDPGYLRRNDAKVAGADPSKLPSHLSAEERNKVLRIKAQLTGVINFKKFGVTQLIANAYGISSRQLNRWENQQDQNRKQRKDDGSNLLTSTKLQNKWLSAYICFKKSQGRQQDRISNTLLEADADDSNFKEQWDTMTPEQQKPYVEMSKAQKDRLPFLIGEIRQGLQATGGYCTWRQLETYLAGDGIPILSRELIRRLVMNLPESTYVSTKLFPALTAAHIIKRKLWCQQFWIFWDSSCKLIRKRILLVHMDEKWFYGIVVRTNNKLVPFLGMEPARTGQVSVHHKNYLGKTMVLVDSAYLPDDYNNIAAGGRGFHGKAIRAGHMIECKTTTYRRQTDPTTGKISYPKIAGNESRIAGQSYFESCEVTANTRVTKNGKRKFSLQHDYWPVQFNYWEALCRQLRYENPGQDFVVLYQWDGAGPHAKKELVAYLVGAFRERGWIFRNQASQSPHLQVHDCNLFPALSKYVSNLQCLGSGSRVVDNDELWELVQRAYYNILTPETIARAFAHHVQIVNAIYSCNGGDGYHRNGGLHCGVRKAYAPKYRLVDGQPIGDPIGVELIETPEEATATQQRLRYERPTPEELDLVDWNTDGLFNRSQLEFLVDNLPYGTPEYLQAETALQGMD